VVLETEETICLLEASVAIKYATFPSINPFDSGKVIVLDAVVFAVELFDPRLVLLLLLALSVREILVYLAFFE
jgi:hypothetical protein